MLYSFSSAALVILLVFIGAVLALSFYLSRQAKSAHGYYAAHGQVHWFINGVAFAGDYLSAASFLGICGMTAFYGYDGFLYSIGLLAGWVVALFVLAEPIKRLGKFTFADALDSQFNSRGIKFAAALSTLVISVFYLIPEMVGAGLLMPLLGLPALSLGPVVISPFTTGVVLVGGSVILIVVTAGMVSTTWVQFIKGTLLVVFCGGLTIAILTRGLSTNPSADPSFHRPRHVPLLDQKYLDDHDLAALPSTGPWQRTPYVRLRDKATGVVTIWRKERIDGWTLDIHPALAADETQYLTKKPDGRVIVNGLPQGHAGGQTDFFPIGNVDSLPETQNESPTSTGPLNPIAYLRSIGQSSITVWQQGRDIVDPDGSRTTIYFPVVKEGSTLLVPGNAPMFAGIASRNWPDRLNFISLMLGLFCGTAVLPHILIRYYTVKDQASARKSTVVGISAIGVFYVLMLFLGLGAMTSGVLDPTDRNMAAPLLAKSFGNMAFAFICAIAFTTVLGTVAGLIMAAAGTVAHDLMHNLFRMKLDDRGQVGAGKMAAVVVGVIAIILGILFQKMNVSFLVGWAFNIAASANLPALVMLLFWRRTTAKGIAASILVGVVSSVGWIFLSADAYTKIYGLDLKVHPAAMPFNQPGLVTIPLAFATLIVVSLVTRRKPASVAN